MRGQERYFPFRMALQSSAINVAAVLDVPVLAMILDGG